MRQTVSTRRITGRIDVRGAAGPDDPFALHRVVTTQDDNGICDAALAELQPR